MRKERAVIFVGDDWAERHHDIAVVDEHGTRLATQRLAEGLEGIARLHALVAEYAADPGEVVIGIETDRGVWVAALVEAGYQVYAINPFSSSRYRDRHATSGAKSDPGDARVLADLVRTDRHQHRQVAADSELAEAVKVLARAHQTMIWTRQRQTNQLRSQLREYYPQALEAFGDDLAGKDAVAVLDRAPSPDQGRALTPAALRQTLRRGGRKRNIDAKAADIHAALQRPQLAQPAQVTRAFAASAHANVAVIGELTHQIQELERDLKDAFQDHPDAEILRSLPGLGLVLGARVLGEFGDAPNRYQDSKHRRNYAGTSPITKTSGTRRVVLARHARNRHLSDATYWWAFASLERSPGARALYDHQRARGATHHQALRALANRLVSILHGCLQHHTPYQETIAWPNTPT
jgi:Transposase/Transposase IS116/IS110/IS902 family